LQQLSLSNKNQHNNNDSKQNNTIIIPLRLAKSKTTSGKTYMFMNSPSSDAKLSKLTIISEFPFELGFSMTIHKAQGRTMKRVILALVARPQMQLEFAAIYVAMSRVKNRDHIRLLYHDNGDTHKAFQYLTKLHLNPYVGIYYAGYESNFASHWNMDKALLSCSL
jgi:hypothetical protein